MATTKKLLVRFDISKKAPFSGDFVIPRLEEGKLVLRGIKSRKVLETGMMVYIGVEVTENDLFARLVDSGAFIEDVEQTLAYLRSYVLQLQACKIGNVVRITPTGEVSGDAFVLELVASTPSSIKT